MSGDTAGKPKPSPYTALKVPLGGPDERVHVETVFGQGLTVSLHGVPGDEWSGMTGAERQRAALSAPVLVARPDDPGRLYALYIDVAAADVHAITDREIADYCDATRLGHLQRVLAHRAGSRWPTWQAWLDRNPLDTATLVCAPTPTVN